MSSCRKHFRPTPFRRTARASCVLGLLPAAAACGGKDPFAPTASLNTVGTSFVLYPVSRVQAPFYSALELRTPSLVQPAVVVTAVNNSAVLAPNFDVAFDLDSAGRIVLLQPKQLVSSQFVPVTGFQTSTARFDSLGAAPGGTYQTDSTARVSVGQTIVVQAQGVRLPCGAGTPFYAKLVVDSVNAASGAMYMRARVDPNCGFRSFAAGVPGS